jgi:hypothetical protein
MPPTIAHRHISKRRGSSNSGGIAKTCSTPSTKHVKENDKPLYDNDVTFTGSRHMIPSKASKSSANATKGHKASDVKDEAARVLTPEYPS